MSSPPQPGPLALDPSRTSPAPNNHDPQHTVPRPSQLIPRPDSLAPASLVLCSARTRRPASPKNTPRPEFAHVSSPATLIQPSMIICRLCHAAFAGDALFSMHCFLESLSSQLSRRSL